MTEVRFYHLQNQSLEQALPALLVKAVQKDNVIVKTMNNHVETLNEHLWTYRSDSFLPHGSAKDGNIDKHPIFITPSDDNPNSAKILILTHGVSSEVMADFDLCCEMLNGRHEAEVEAARARWKDYKERGFEVTYWQQSEHGGWEQKV